jgi:hypothetical protein
VKGFYHGRNQALGKFSHDCCLGLAASLFCRSPQFGLVKTPMAGHCHLSPNYLSFFGSCCRALVSACL